VVRRDQQGRGTVEVEWDVPPGTPPDFTFLIERAEGDGSRFQEAGVVSRNQFAAQRQPPGEYSYRIVARDRQGHQLVSDPVPVRISFDGPVYVDGPYPNPVRGRATLVLTARQFQDTTLEIFNSIGQRMYYRKRVLGPQEPMRFSLNSREWASGLYVIRVQGQTFTTTRKMMVVR
jgi:hypothetical protein